MKGKGKDEVRKTPSPNVVGNDRGSGSTVCKGLWFTVGRGVGSLAEPNLPCHVLSLCCSVRPLSTSLVAVLRIDHVTHAGGYIRVSYRGRVFVRQGSSKVAISFCTVSGRRARLRRLLFLRQRVLRRLVLFREVLCSRMRLKRLNNP